MSEKIALLMPTEVSHLLKIPLPSVYELARKGEIPGAFKVGRHWRFCEADVIAWLQRKATRTSSESLSAEVPTGEANERSVGASLEGTSIPGTRKILVIEDDLMVLKSLIALLKKNGYEAVGCTSGTEGLEKFHEDSWSLVLSDIRMAEMDGIETVQKIRDIERRKQAPQTPVIMMTAFADENAPVRAIKLGVQDYFMKPFDMKSLLESIQTFSASEN